MSFPRLSHRHFLNLVELLVILMVLSLLLALLIPNLRNAAEGARQLVCQNNLKNIGMLCDNYADNHHGWNPGGMILNHPDGNNYHYAYWFEFLHQDGLYELVTDKNHKDGQFGANTSVDLTCPSGNEGDGPLGKYLTWAHLRAPLLADPSLGFSKAIAELNVSYTVNQYMGRGRVNNPDKKVRLFDHYAASYTYRAWHANPESNWELSFRRHSTSKQVLEGKKFVIFHDNHVETLFPESFTGWPYTQVHGSTYWEDP